MSNEICWICGKPIGDDEPHTDEDGLHDVHSVCCEKEGPCSKK
jgi:hypothetical protein